MQAREITVVGAGIIGVCCALHLQQAGHCVTLIDRGAPGEGCSMGNAGLFESNAVVPLASPGILKQIPRLLLDPLGPLAIKWAHLPRLVPWLSRFVLQGAPGNARANAKSLAPLVKNAMPAYAPLMRASKTKNMVHDTGWIWVFERKTTLEKMRWEFELLNDLGIEWTELGAGEIAAKAPGLASDIERGVYFPTTRACTNPFRFVQLLAQTFKQNGGSIHRGEVEQVLARDGEIIVQTREGNQSCETVVIAAGAWSAKFARQLGEPVPLGTERGYHVMLPEAATGLPVPLMFAEHKFVAHKMEHGLRLAGTAELGGLDRPPDWRRADVILNHARRLLPGLNEHGLGRWMGYRPTFPDSLPVIGPSGRHENVYYAFGHQHLGLTLGGITAEMIVAMVGGEEPRIAPEPYRINRF